MTSADFTQITHVVVAGSSFLAFSGDSDRYRLQCIPSGSAIY